MARSLPTEQSDVQELNIVLARLKRSRAEYREALMLDPWLAHCHRRFRECQRVADELMSRT